MGVKIHETAVVSSRAELDGDIEIGPFAVIEDQVKIASGTKVGPHAVISGRTRIGKNNLISAFASIGSRPQDLKYNNEDTELHIEDNNMFREYCNVSLGTVTGDNVTKIGSHNLFMVYTHVAHDCEIGDHTILANGVALAGHVRVHDKAVLGGLSAVHQFCRIGSFAMIAGGAMVTQDVAPYCMVHGDRAQLSGLNVVGLRRMSLTPEEVSSIKEMYRLTFSSNLKLDDAIEKIKSDVSDSEYRAQFLLFLSTSSRGLCR